MKTKTKPKRKKRLGRPATKHGVYDSVRAIGRVPDQSWDRIQEAFQKQRTQPDGIPYFNQWAASILLNKANLILR